ncbi:MAG: penicillin-binding protein activator LpoB [Gammaproteobacteria bacterium]|nr:penicillin-binding protein activator LpoB [Gammaproteobacteria bacterium]
MKAIVKSMAPALAAVLMLGGCATKVERMETDAAVDLSGKWNDTDSRLVSEEMIGDVLSHRWVGEFSQGHAGKRPAVIVGEIRNLSHEHISVVTFINDLEREIINSGKVDFVASSQEREDIRAERKDQDLNASEETRKPMGKELGADFMLKGDISTILDTEGKQQVRYYQVDLTLISLADNRKVWVGQKKIKKLVTKPGLRL